MVWPVWRFIYIQYNVGAFLTFTGKNNSTLESKQNKGM